jgi:transcription antitermination factor NusG
VDSLNASDAEMSQKFQPGDLVTIRGGALAGYTGIFNSQLPGQDRVEVLLRMLQGSYMRVQVPIEQITLQKR